MRFKNLLHTLLALSNSLPAAAVWSQGRDQYQRFSVPATNPKWTPTGIQISPGDLVALYADGRVRTRPTSGDVGPQGAASGEGALELMIGSGAAQVVGEQSFLIAGNAGEVKLRVRDGRYDDNTGAFAVSMTYFPRYVVHNSRDDERTQRVSEDFIRRNGEMRSTLRGLVIAEEGFYGDSARYTKSVAQLSFTPSPGVTVMVDSVAVDAWRGTAKHTELPGWTCGIYVGAVPPYSPEQIEADPVCWRDL